MNSKKPIYILAPFPIGEDLRDGMMQRIAVVDDLLKSRDRIYINISVKNKLFKKIIHSSNVTEYFLNPLNPYLVFKYFISSSHNIYAHSIHPFKFIPYFFLFFKSKYLVLDAHGVVPEEILMYGKPIRYQYALWIEKKVFGLLTHCICVTNTMINHFKERYPKSPAKFHLFATSVLMDIPKKEEVDKLRKELNYSVNDVVFLYSGNIQTWQNIPLMIKLMERIEGHKILILTGAKESFKAAFAESKVNLNNITIISVDPKELNKYYALCHYGFILRDESIINKVANPTKMLEYLQFGLLPVVLSPKIGDYFLMNYEYLELKAFDATIFSPRKSNKNMDIAKQVHDSKDNVKIVELFS